MHARLYKMIELLSLKTQCAINILSYEVNEIILVKPIKHRYYSYDH